MCSTEGGKEVEVLVWHVPPLVHPLMPNTAASLAIVWCVKPGQVPKAANCPPLKAGWVCSVFHQYNHLAAFFVPSIHLEDSIEMLANNACHY